jgi:2-oxoglutarate/2-oxoacid ferredoxin oxidoreductase subunit alpha
VYLRAKFPGLDPLQYNRIDGKPFKIAELATKSLELL